jgi:hypothetical protein
MTFLEKIKNELFIKETILIETMNSTYYGRRTSNKEIFYFTHEFGYFLYLPKVNVSEQMFDPINPTSFTWHLFNKQIIFVPTSNMPFKQFFILQQDLNDYIIRFNLEFLRKYRSVWVETDNENMDFYFLLRKPEVKKIIMEQEDTNETNNVKIEKILVNDNTELIFEKVTVMPEFLRANTLIKTITINNLDDIWKHWLLEEHGMSITNERYRNKYKDEEWSSKVLGELIVNNMTTKYEKNELDADLKRLLGIE